MVKVMGVGEKFELIKRNTAEILGEVELKDLLGKERQLGVYLGTAITGSPHVAYFTWVIKLADFVKAGCKVKLLLADLHGAMDNTPWDLLEKRYQYYAKILPLMFESLGVKKGVEFVKGSSFQLNKHYELDLMKLTTNVSVHDAKKAASEVVKLGDNPRLSGLLYPLMQALDEEYLDVDIQYGGIDQRKIFVLAMENLPKIGYKKRIHIMTPIIPGLIGNKMSASISKSKIDLLDGEETVNKKINEAECVAGDVNNGLMGFLKYVILVVKRDRKEKFVVKREKKYGGDLIYSSYVELDRDFKNKKLHPLDLKIAISKEINEILKPIRKKGKELERLWKKAFMET